MINIDQKLSALGGMIGVGETSRQRQTDHPVTANDCYREKTPLQPAQLPYQHWER
jgi:hypothetical protein